MTVQRLGFFPYAERILTLGPELTWPSGKNALDVACYVDCLGSSRVSLARKTRVLSDEVVNGQ